MNNPEELCIAAEKMIREIQAMLAQPRPDRFEKSSAALQRVTEMLQELVRVSAGRRDPALYSAMRNLRQSARQLKKQVRHAENFLSGWIELTNEARDPQISIEA